ncbi:hypothetical protein HDU76_012534 [Blyttiomyces sp. JEL0837]|nr:hypothetical protein HDU76_012534 [Blyttiomyces sp. JEL0837]
MDMIGSFFTRKPSLTLHHPFASTTQTSLSQSHLNDVLESEESDLQSSSNDDDLPYENPQPPPIRTHSLPSENLNVLKNKIAAQMGCPPESIVITVSSNNGNPSDAQNSTSTVINENRTSQQALHNEIQELRRRLSNIEKVNGSSNDINTSVDRTQTVLLQYVSMNHKVLMDLDCNMPFADLERKIAKEFKLSSEPFELYWLDPGSRLKTTYDVPTRVKIVGEKALRIVLNTARKNDEVASFVVSASDDVSTIVAGPVETVWETRSPVVLVENTNAEDLAPPSTFSQTPPAPPPPPQSSSPIPPPLPPFPKATPIPPPPPLVKSNPTVPLPPPPPPTAFVAARHASSEDNSNANITKLMADSSKLPNVSFTEYPSSTNTCFLVNIINEGVGYAIELSTPSLDELGDKICKQFAWNKDELSFMEIVHESTVVASEMYFQVTVQSFQESRKIAVFLLRPKVPPAPPSTVASTSVVVAKEFGKPAQYDVMLSYEWASGKDLVKRIKRELETRGLSVWFDEEQMHGNMFERMAEAILHSSVITPLLTVGYSKSSNCKLELSYACSLKKRIDPARATKENERLDAWAELATAGLIYYDFSDLSRFHDNMKSLYDGIRAHLERNALQQEKVSIGVDEPLAKWLQHINFETDISKFESDYVPGTRQWAVDGVHQWLVSQDNTLLWLNGGAGLGKSIIAFLVSRNLPENFELGSAFFCKHDDDSKNNAKNIVTTIAFDLALKLPEFRSFLEKNMATDLEKIAKGETSILDNPSTAFNNLIIKGLNEISKPSTNILIIIDALDEIGKQGDQSRNEFLNVLRFDVSQLPPWIRIFTTSRPEMDIYQVLSGVNSSVLVPEDSNNLHDIEVFVRHLLTRELSVEVPLSNKELDSIVSTIAGKTGGVFHYARLACNSLTERSYENFNDVSNEASKFDGGLDQIYVRVLEKAFLTGEKDLIDRFQKVMGAMITVREPVDQASIARLVGLSVGDVGGVVLRIQPILNISSGTVKVLHKSLKDFLSSPERCKNPAFFININHFETILATSCLTIMTHDLKYNMCNLESDSVHIPPNVQQSISPVVAYACKFWITHLLASKDASTIPSLSNFCSTSMLFWIEAMVILGSFALELGNKSRLIAHWIKKNSNTVISTSDDSTTDYKTTTISMLEDAARMMWRFKTEIAANPLQVYSVAITFTPQETTIYKTYASKYAATNLQMFPRELVWGPHLQSFLGHAATVESVVFSHDGNLVASVSGDKTVRVWDLRTGKETRRFEGHKVLVTCVCFSYDGKFVVSGSGDKTVRVWDVGTGKEWKRLDGNSKAVSCVDISTDGKWIVSGGDDKTVRIWDVETGFEIKRLDNHAKIVLSVCFSDDGKTVLSAEENFNLILWNAESGDIIKRFDMDSVGKRLHCIATQFINSAGKAIWSESRQITIYDLETSTSKQLVGHSENVTCVSLSLDGARAVSGGRDMSVIVWDIESGKILWKLDGHSDWISAVRFSPDGRKVVSGSRDHTVRIWDIESGREMSGIESSGHSDYLSSIGISPDGKRVISGSGDATVRIWEIDTGKELRRLTGHKEFVNMAWFSHDGTKMASASGDKNICIYDSETGDQLLKLKGHTKQVSAIAFSYDGSMLVSASTDQTIRIWDSITGSQLRLFNYITKFIPYIYFSPDGTKVIAGDGSRECVVVWDLQSETHEGEPEMTKLERSFTRSIEFELSRDGTFAIPLENVKRNAMFEHLMAVGSFYKAVRVKDSDKVFVFFTVRYQIVVLVQE